MGFEINEFLLFYSIHLPDISDIPCIAWRGTDTKLSFTPGVSKYRIDIFPRDVSGQLLLCTLGLPLSQNACSLPCSSCLSQGCLMPVYCPSVSPLHVLASPACSRIFQGMLQVAKMPSLSSPCQSTCWSIIVVALCSARPWWVGRGGMALGSPGPSTQKLPWGWREEQSGSKEEQGRTKGQSQLFSAEGFLTPG